MTHDGGLHWLDAGLPHSVVGVSPTGGRTGTVLVLTASSRGVALWRSEQGSEAWVRLGRGLTGSGNRFGTSLAGKGRDVFVLGLSRPDLLAVSVDGGATFVRRPGPCAAELFYSPVTVGPEGDVWILCADEPQTGAYQPRKRVYRSADAGRTWSLMGTSLDAGSFGQLRIGFRGNALLLLDRGPLLLTRDSGRTWARVSRPDDDRFREAGWTGPSRAFALVDDVIRLSTDGGLHWRARALQPSLVRRTNAFPDDAFFLTPDTGWVIATDETCAHPVKGRCGLIVESTRDGGQSWQVLRSRGLPLFGGTQQIRFADGLDGWVVADDRLWATKDGGHVWHAVRLAGQVLAVEPAGGRTGDVAVLTSQSSRAVLWRATVTSGTWTRVGQGLDLSTRNSPLRLARGGGRIEVVRYQSDSRPYDGLAVSTDRGSTFAARQTPCAAKLWFDESVTNAPDGSLWMVCASEPGSGALQPNKHIYRSADDGRSWRLVGLPDAIGSDGRLAVLSRTTALMVLDRGPLMITRDGGRHWRPAVTDNDDGGFGAAAWTSATTAYALTARILWTTKDGGHHWIAYRFDSG
jgi:photosystem II stability/assembly factor-like uncharacterized protein